METILMFVIKTLLYAAGVIISTLIIWAFKQYVFPWLNAKLGDVKYDALKKRVKDLMSAAEEKFDEASAGKKKSEYVIETILKIFPDLNAEYVQSIIDGLMKPLVQEGIVNTSK